MTVQIPCFGERWQGTREYQEDAFDIQEGYSGYLLLVCDGMGGHIAGERASHLAIQGFIDEFSSAMQAQLDIPESLRKGVEGANLSISNAVANEPQLKGMGTTLLVAYVLDTKLYWASIGDSPLWLVRQGTLERLNEDHSLAAVFSVLVEQGRMTQKDALNDPKRHVLRSALKGEDIELCDIREEPFLLDAGDRILLASDGLDTLSNDEIVEGYEAAGADPQQQVETLLNKVKGKQISDQDNVTVISYQCTDTMAAGPDEVGECSGLSVQPKMEKEELTLPETAVSLNSKPAKANSINKYPRYLYWMAMGGAGILLIALLVLLPEHPIDNSNPDVVSQPDTKPLPDNPAPIEVNPTSLPAEVVLVQQEPEVPVPPTATEVNATTLEVSLPSLSTEVVQQEPKGSVASTDKEVKVTTPDTNPPSLSDVVTQGSEVVIPPVTTEIKIPPPVDSLPSPNEVVTLEVEGDDLPQK